MDKLFLLFLSLSSLLNNTLSCTCVGYNFKDKYCNSKVVIKVNITGSDDHYENGQEQTNEKTTEPYYTLPEHRDRYHQAKVLKVYKGDVSEGRTVTLVTPGYHSMCQTHLSVGSTYIIVSNNFEVNYCDPLYYNNIKYDDQMKQFFEDDYKTVKC